MSQGEFLMRYVESRMSCKCFANKPAFKDGCAFSEKLQQAKCTCSARFIVSEKRSKFGIEPNNDLSEIDKIKIDGYLVPSSETRKCDYLFIYKPKDANPTFVFVELKGQDLNTALSQLEQTIDLFRNNNLLKDVRVRGGIVFTTYPNDNGTYRKLKRSVEGKFKKVFPDFRIEQYSTYMIYNCVSDKFRKG